MFKKFILNFFKLNYLFFVAFNDKKNFKNLFLILIFLIFENNLK